MDNEIKRILKVGSLFVLFIASIFAMITIAVSKHCNLIVKIIALVIGISLSILSYFFIVKINNKSSKGNKILLEKKEVVVKEKAYSTKLVLCPKCRKPYDGIRCFYCGFEKENNG